MVGYKTQDRYLRLKAMMQTLGVEFPLEPSEQWRGRNKTRK